MRKPTMLFVVLLGLMTVWQLAPSFAERTLPRTAEPQIGHMVFFSLKDNSADAKAKLVAACDKFLAGHDGAIYYSAGTRAEEFKREVNDQEYDVALHLVFRDKAAHDKYQEHERHKQFIAENKENWKKVRVFDSYVRPTP